MLCYVPFHTVTTHPLYIQHNFAAIVACGAALLPRSKQNFQMMAPAFTPVDLEAPDQNAWMACKSSSFTITNCTHKGRDLYQYASPVALAVYASMLDLQPALETKLLPSMLRVSFLRASDSYVIS